MILTYLLKSTKDSSYYVGITSDINRRLDEHNSGKLKTTSSKRPWILAFIREHKDYTEARKHEKWLKKKNRQYKDKLAQLAPPIPAHSGRGKGRRFKSSSGLQMKKIIKFILPQLKYFFLNPFWTSWINIVILVISLALNGLIWYLYLGKYHEIINLTPIGYSSGVLLLNLFLAAVIYPKQKMISFIFLGTSLLIEIFILFLIKISFYLGAF